MSDASLCICCKFGIFTCIPRMHARFRSSIVFSKAMSELIQLVCVKTCRLWINVDCVWSSRLRWTPCESQTNVLNHANTCLMQFRRPILLNFNRTLLICVSSANYSSSTLFTIQAKQFSHLDSSPGRKQQLISTRWDFGTFSSFTPNHASMLFP